MKYNHHPEVISGIREEDCAALLKDFFQQLRLTLRNRPKWHPGALQKQESDYET
jgi:hypothetical protein